MRQIVGRAKLKPNSCMCTHSKYISSSICISGLHLHVSQIARLIAQSAPGSSSLALGQWTALEPCIDSI